MAGLVFTGAVIDTCDTLLTESFDCANVAYTASLSLFNGI